MKIIRKFIKHLTDKNDAWLEKEWKETEKFNKKHDEHLDEFVKELNKKSKKWC